MYECNAREKERESVCRSKKTGRSHISDVTYKQMQFSIQALMHKHVCRILAQKYVIPKSVCKYAVPISVRKQTIPIFASVRSLRKNKSKYGTKENAQMTDKISSQRRTQFLYLTLSGDNGEQFVEYIHVIAER